jgi:hypothetical protein
MWRVSVVTMPSKPMVWKAKRSHCANVPKHGAGSTNTTFCGSCPLQWASKKVVTSPAACTGSSALPAHWMGQRSRGASSPPKPICHSSVSTRMMSASSSSSENSHSSVANSDVSAEFIMSISSVNGVSFATAMHRTASWKRPKFSSGFLPTFTRS